MHKTFRSEHPHTLHATDNLASVYTQLRRWEDAMPLYATIATVREMNLGPHHEHIVQSTRDMVYVTRLHRDEQTGLHASAIHSVTYL